MGYALTSYAQLRRRLPISGQIVTEIEINNEIEKKLIESIVLRSWSKCDSQEGLVGV